MSFVGGILQGILTDVVKDFLLKKRTPKESWGCALLILAVFVGGLLLLGGLLNLSSKETNQIWGNVKVGDSLFVLDTYGIDFYKKGRVKLQSYEQREIKYAIADTIEFIKVNNVNDKFFFKNKTSFIGICIGIDSTQAKNGNRWLMVKPSNAVTQPPKPKDQYDFETRRWENKMFDLLNQTKLSKEFYVNASDVVLKNNDKQFK